jgi:hypothetical protein
MTLAYGTRPSGRSRRRRALVLERTAHALGGRLELHVAFAVLHEDLGHCAPGDVALAGGIPVKQVERLADQERQRSRMDPGWRL